MRTPSRKRTQERERVTRVRRVERVVVERVESLEIKTPRVDRMVGEVGTPLVIVFEIGPGIVLEIGPVPPPRVDIKQKAVPTLNLEMHPGNTSWVRATLVVMTV